VREQACAATDRAAGDDTSSKQKDAPTKEHDTYLGLIRLAVAKLKLSDLDPSFIDRIKTKSGGVAGGQHLAATVYRILGRWATDHDRSAGQFASPTVRSASGGGDGHTSSA
jgi:hypothetical protein